MAFRAPADIRNIALVGHAGAGKTSLAEALLHIAGARPSRGEVDRGDTVTDFDPMEHRYHHSLNLALAGLEHRGRRLNLIDTPGYPDFQAQAMAGLAAAETMALIVNAQTGIEPMTRRMMEWAAGHRMPAMVIINKIDAAPDRLAGLLEELTASFGRKCLPLELPADNAEEVVEVLGHAEGTADFSSVAAAHAALVEQVVEVDEAVMERYLAEGDLAPEVLHAPFEQALREGHLVPVCFASARTGAGVAQLLDVLSDLAPSPLEGSRRPFISRADGGGQELWAEPDPELPLLAHVFKIDHDPFAGTLGLVRIHQGRIQRGGQLLVGREGKVVKATHLLGVQGKERWEIPEAVAGDICALAKVEELRQDAVLHADHEQDGIGPARIGYPTPLVGLALHAVRRGDEQKIMDVLHRLAAEDPGLRIEQDVTANETVLRGLGDFHLRVALERLDEHYHVAVETHPPSIPYRETITTRASGHHRHKKQTGGAGQFGEVFLEAEPLDRGAGFELVDHVTGGAIPAPLIPAVEKGVRQVLASGALAGFPVEDVQVTVTDGKHHSVDSKEIAFVIAGRKAFLEAFYKARPVLLEPLVDLEVTVPEAGMGDISGELAGRRARIRGSEHRAGGRVTVRAQAPLAELTDFATRIKALTGGEGSWSLQFSHYEPAPSRVQEELAGRLHPPEA